MCNVNVLQRFTVLTVSLAIALPPIAGQDLTGQDLMTHAQAANGFFCDQDGNESSGTYPTVVAVSQGQSIHLLTVTDNTQLPPFDDVIARCNQIAARFQNSFIREGAAVFNHLTFGYVDNRPVLCVPSNDDDRQNGTCQPNDVLLTFQNEQRGCLFIPAFLENLMRQGAGGLSGDTDFDAMRDLCQQTFSTNAGQRSNQVEEAFRSLNPIFSSNSASQ